MGLFRSHTVTSRANKISEFTVATAEYGAAVPEVLGTTRISGNVIYYDDFTAHEHKESHRSGKGGGSKSVSITYTYTVAVIVGLCEGQISGIGNVWIGKDMYAYPNDKIQLTLFDGREGQKAWPYVVGKHPKKALPYTGLAYMAGVIDLGDSGSMPNYNFEVKGKLLDSGDGVDVNPADYIRYVLDKAGLSKTEIVGLDNYRTYCKAADLLISTPMDQTGAQETRSIINAIATLTNAYMFWSNDKFKIVVLDDREYDGWTPDKTILYDLTADDFIPQNGQALVTYSRKDSSEIYNQYPVEFTNRANGYEKETVSYALTEDIKDYGLRQASATNAGYIYTKERAVKIAEMLARKNQYERNQYTFKLDWSFCRLEVGDLVTLTDVNCGLDHQVVRINSVTEGTDGLLTLTAVSQPDGTYTQAKYDVHDVDRPFVDYNAPAPDTDTPVILQPPADLTQDGTELWIGAKGKTDNWGGCDVYVSDDQQYYRHAGRIASSARIGTLASDITATATDIEVKVNGTFLPGTKQDAERGNTLCWLEGECLSYQTADLLQNGNYKLGGCLRGQYHTSAVSHSGGASFARLDTALLRIPFLKEDIGKTIWLKFVSYNIFGAGEQDISSVDPYTYTLLPYYIPAVRNLKAHNRYRHMKDGVSRYDIEVSWDPPDGMTSYLEGQVWFKTNHDQGDRLVIVEGQSGDELGFSGEWRYAGSGKTSVTIPQAVVGDRYRIAVTTKDQWGMATSPDTAPRIDLLVAMKSTIPNIPDGFGITFGAAAIVSWQEVTNTDIDFYEVRLDDNPGAENTGLLIRTNGLEVALTLPGRCGTLYLYARNALAKYSDPAKLTYYKPAPIRPNPLKLTAKLGGISIEADPVPADCNGMNVYIDDTLVHTVNNTVTHTCDPGVYGVQAAYTDIFGEGPRTNMAYITVKALVDESLIEEEAITLKQVNQVIKDAVVDAQKSVTDIAELKKTDSQIQATVTETKKDLTSQITQNANSITSIITNLNKAPSESAYSAIVQLLSAINLRVQKGDVVNQINMSPSGTLIDGKYLHITGLTQIDNNVIVNGMLDSKSVSADKIQAGAVGTDQLAAKAVTANKMSVDSLDAITATIGTLRTKTSGARVEIKDNLIQVYDENNVLRVRLGVW